MNQRIERTVLAAILLAFVLLSTTYSVVVPPFEASDELWHYPMVHTIAENWSLPVQDPANVGPWRQEGSQPPLYYAVTAVATSWIDTSNMAEVRHLNPHVDNGIATPDGNVNLVVHKPERESFPWTGTVLAVHVARLLSVAMATLGVALTYFVVREVVPERPALALGATAIHAFTPMVAFIAGSVNNDNLVVPLSSLALWMLLRLLRLSRTEPGMASRPPLVRYLLLGCVLGLAALTKASALALTLLTALVVTVRAVRRGWDDRMAGWREFLVGGFATLMPVVIIAGWWYVRNVRLYGDPTGLSAFIEILGQREVPASLAQLWRERQSFLAGYWGNFGGLNVPMSPWIYRVLNATLVVAGLGLAMAFAGSLTHVFGLRRGSSQMAEWEDEGHTSPFNLWRSARASGAAVSNLPFVVCLLWGLGVLIPWIQWARVTWSSQGRLIYAALPVWSLLIVLGLSTWVRRLPGVRGRLNPPPLVLLLALFLLGLSVVAPWVWIQPAYQLPTPLGDVQVENIPERTNVTFDDTVQLLGHKLEDQTTKAGGQVTVTLYWEAIAPTEEDHTVFVHLLDEHELVIGQRDTFPGLGLLSTTWLDPGQRWADRYVIPVPATTYAPNEAQIEVGLFNTRTGERLTALGPDGESRGDNVRFGEVSIRTHPGDVPNPISVNFGDQMLLAGYDLSERAVHPGETITLTLHWEALRAMEANYTVSAQVIEAGSQQKAAQHDSWPRDGAAPTAAWQPGEPVVDTIPLEVFPDAAAGPYSVRIAVYAHQEGKIKHLPVTPPGGRMQASHVTLTQVRVAP